MDITSIGKQTQEAVSKPKLSERQIQVLSITTYLEFLELALYLDILGHFDSVYESISKILIKDQSSLEHSHIRFSAKFPASHPVNDIFARASVKTYICKLLEPNYENFKFQAEIDDLSHFAGALLREVGKAFNKKRYFSEDYLTSKIRFTDPLTGHTFDVTPKFR